MQKYFDINKEGHSIKCKIYCEDMRGIKKLVLFGHGFGGHKDNKAAEKFAEKMMSKYKAAALMTFDWPAHGSDVKKRCELGLCLEYLRLVLQYITDTLSPERLFGYATSFGGFVFLKYINDNGCPFEKIALRAPAIDMYSSFTGNILTEENKQQLSRGREVMAGFDMKVRINSTFTDELKANDLFAMDFIDYADRLLIIHGSKDEIVPIAKSREFSEKNVIEMVAVPDADHRFKDPLKMDSAIWKIIEFYNL